jgi:subtilase family serine protease
MVSAICPNCTVLLVEAQDASISNLGAAVNKAVTLGANVVSNSYGGSEYSGEGSDSTTYFNHPGVAVVVASGDSGYGAQFPAASPYVTAVGGTSLYQAANTGSRNATETAWSGAGSGCSTYEGKPVWQKDTGCTNRTIADTSAVADPNTGVWVYDTYGTGGWVVFGGTSVATPIVGSVYALAANSPSGGLDPASYPYAHQPAGLNDITSGSNGSCAPALAYLCTAEVGYDGPTGLGTPNATAAFTAAAVVTTAPGAPRNLSATAGNASVTLTWSAPSSNGGAAITSYDVYRSTTSGTTRIATTGGSAASYTDTVANGTTYYYEVAAVNKVGTGPLSNQASATPTLVATVPSAPQNLTAKTDASRGVDLAWSAPSSNGGSAITSYQIYRGTRLGQESYYATISCTLASCAYANTSTRRGTTYYYELVAVNKVGTGPLSNQAFAKAR